MSRLDDLKPVERGLQVSSVAAIIGLVLVIGAAVSGGVGTTIILAIIVLAIAAVLTSWAYYRVRGVRYNESTAFHTPGDQP